MRENHTNMTSIDQLFKDQFDQVEIAFDPMAWEMLEQTKKKRRGFFFWFNGRKNILLIALIGLLVLPVAFLWMQNKSFDTPALSTVVEEDEDHLGTIESGAKTKLNPQLSQIESTNANEKSNSPQESPQLSQLQANEFSNEVVDNSTIDVESTSGQDVSAIALSKEEEISTRSSQFEEGSETSNSIGAIRLFQEDNKIYYPILNFEYDVSGFETINEKVSEIDSRELEKTATELLNRRVEKLATLGLLENKLLTYERGAIKIEPVHVLQSKYEPKRPYFAEVQFQLYAGDFQDGSLNVIPFPMSIGYRWLDTRVLYSNVFVRYDYTGTDRAHSLLDIDPDRSFNLQAGYREHMLTLNGAVGLRFGRFFTEVHGGLGLASLSKSITLRAGDFDNPEIAQVDGHNFKPYVRSSFGLTIGAYIKKNDIQIFGSLFQSSALRSTLTDETIEYPTIDPYECDRCYEWFERRYNQPLDVLKITVGIRKTIF